jgi:hypothetical protein
MTDWQYYPKSNAVPEHLYKMVSVFKQNEEYIDSSKHKHNSNAVLSYLKNNLQSIGFTVEKGKKAEERIKIPVLFGRKGQLEKYFEVDAFQKETGTVLEVEAGRAVDNNQFLKDLFEACVMQKVDYLAIAVRMTYRRQSDFGTVITYFDALYASDRLNLPLKGVLIIGY